MSENQSKKTSPWFWVAFALLGIASGVALARLILRALDKTSSGAGLETYRTVWGIEFNHIGLLVSFGFVFIVALVGVGYRAHEWWQLKHLKNKYGNKNT